MFIQQESAPSYWETRCAGVTGKGGQGIAPEVFQPLFLSDLHLPCDLQLQPRLCDTLGPA